jgi:hypothetical protein
MAELPAGYALDTTAPTQAVPEGYTLDGQSAPTSKPNTLLGYLKAAGAGVANGTLAMGGMPADIGHLIGQGVSYAGDKLGYDPKKVDALKTIFQTGAKGIPELAPFANSQNTTDNLTKNVESLTGPIYKPQNEGEKHVENIAAFLPAAATGPAGLGRSLVLRGLLPGVVSDALGTAGAAIDPSLETPGRVIGALASPSGIKKAALPTKESVMEKIAAAEQSAGAKFDAARNSGVGVKPEVVGNMATNVRNTLDKDMGIVPTGDPLDPNTRVFNLLDRLEKVDPNGPGASLRDIHNMRKRANLMVASDPRGELGFSAGVLRDHIDDLLSGLPDNPQHLVVPKAEAFNSNPRMVRGTELPEPDLSLKALPAPTEQPLQGGYPRPAVIDHTANDAADAIASKAAANDATAQRIQDGFAQQDAHEGVKNLKDAIGDWAAARQGERVLDAINDAERNAGGANSGRNLGNAINQTFKRFVQGKAVQGRGLSDAERATVEALTRGKTPGAQKYRVVGNMLGGGGGLGKTAIAGGGFLADGGTGALTGLGLGLIGDAARSKYNGMIMNNALGVADSAASRAPSLQALLDADMPAMKYSRARTAVDRILRAALGTSAVYQQQQ